MTLDSLLIARLADELADVPESLARFQDDPVGFGEQILGEHYAAEIKEIMRSVVSNQITIAKSANAFGKTYGAARLAVWFYKVFPDAQVYTTAAAPLGNLRRLLWGEIGSLVRDHPDLFANDNITSMHIARNSRSYLTGVTIPSSGTSEQREARFSGKHAPHLMFIVDEGDAVPDEVYRGIESCMSGGHVRLLIMFNPRAMVGPVYRMEHQRQANVIQLNAFDHPNVVTGEDVIPGAVRRDTVVRRLNEWSRPLLAEEEVDASCFEVPSFLVGETAERSDGQGFYDPLPGGWRKITEGALSYMVLGEYPPEGEQQLISRVWIDAARSRWDAYVATCGEIPPEHTQARMGLDVAEMGPDKNAACFRYGGYVARLRLWQDVDPDSTAERAANLYHQLKCYRADVDATGVGAGVPGRMRKLGCKIVRGVKVARRSVSSTDLGQFYQLRDELYWRVREWLRTDAGAMLPPDRNLVDELRVLTYEVRDGSIRIMPKKIMKKLLGRSPDRLDALMMTFIPAGTQRHGIAIVGQSSPLRSSIRRFRSN